MTLKQIKDKILNDLSGNKKQPVKEQARLPIPFVQPPIPYVQPKVTPQQAITRGVQTKSLSKPVQVQQTQNEQILNQIKQNIGLSTPQQTLQLNAFQGLSKPTNVNIVKAQPVQIPQTPALAKNVTELSEPDRYRLNEKIIEGKVRDKLGNIGVGAFNLLRGKTLAGEPIFKEESDARGKVSTALMTGKIGAIDLIKNNKDKLEKAGITQEDLEKNNRYMDKMVQFTAGVLDPVKKVGGKKVADALKGVADDLIESKKITAKKGGKKLVEEAPMQKDTALLDQVPESAGLKFSEDTLQLPDIQKFQQELQLSLPDKVSDIYYNLNRLNIDDKAKQRLSKEIAGLSDEIKEVIGDSKLSNKQVVELADSSTRVLNKIITKEQTAEKIASNLNLRKNIAKSVQDGKIDEEFIRSFLVDKSISTDIARQLQARRINADPLEATGIEIILDNIRKTGAKMDEVIEASKGVDFNNEQQTAEFYRKFVKPNYQDWLDLLRYNSMLTSPNTHLVNVGSNYVGTGILAPVEKVVEGGLDALRVAMFGGKRTAYAGESLPYIKAYYGNVGKAWNNVRDVMAGRVQVDTPDIRNIPLIPKGQLKKVENVLRTPLKVLGAMDTFFSTLTREGAEASLKYKQGKGVNVKQLERLAKQEARQRIFQGELTNKKDGYVLNAIGTVANQVNMLRNNDNPIVSTIAKFTAPFVNTPTNILKQGIEYSPFGITTMIGSKNPQRQLAKSIMGTGMALTASSLIGDDRLTWGYPTTEDEKKAWDSAGRKPYSVKVNDKWIPFNRIHPIIGFNFAIAAAIDDAIKNKKLNENEADTLLAGLSKYYQFFADQSMMKNMGDFLRTAKGDIQGPARVISNYVSQLIPFRALLGWTERLVDPTVRQADPDGSILDKQLQYIASQIPGLSTNVPPKLTLDGEPVVDKLVWTNAFSPVGAIGKSDELGEIYYYNLKQLKKEARDVKQQKEAKKKQIQSIYDKAQELKSQGNEEGAKGLVDILSDDDYKIYESIKKSDINRKYRELEPSVLPTYRAAQELKAKGDEAGALELVNRLTDDEYKAYTNIKNKLSQ